VRSRNGSAGVTIDEGPGSTSAATGLVAIRLQVLFRDEAVSLRAVDDRRTRLTGLPTLAELQQVFRMDLEETALDGGRATQPPQETGAIGRIKPAGQNIGTR